MTERAVVPVTPDLRVVRGEATPEEIAALTAVLLARGEDPAYDAHPQPSSSAWADRAALLRQPIRPGPGAWRR